MAQPFNLGNSFLGKSTIELVNPDIADSANNRTEISVDADGDLFFQRYKDGAPKGNLKFPVHSYGQSEKKDMHTDANGDVRFVNTWTAPIVGLEEGGGASASSITLSDIGEMNSLRFDGTSWLSWTPSQAFTNSTTYEYTLSFWVKKSRNNIDQGQALFFCTDGSSGGGINFAGIGAGGGAVNDDLNWNNRNAATGTSDYVIRTKRLFKDTSAWYHITLMYQSSSYTGQGYGADNRSDWSFIVSVNGEELLKGSDYGSDMHYSGGANYVSDWLFGGQQEHLIGKNYWDANGNFQGYLANIQFIDGAALDPTAFGERISDIWVPKEYTGTYGTNGFHLDFDQSNMDWTSGKVLDASGNGNNWDIN